MSGRDIDAYVAKARELYCDDDIEIDDASNPSVSIAEEGVWVQAWVWVGDNDL